MGKVVLFAPPTTDPVRPWLEGRPWLEAPWFPTESEILLHGREAMHERQWMTELSRQLDISAFEKFAVIASVLGMPELTQLNSDDASNKLVELTQREDVCAILTAFQQGKAAANREAR